MAKNLKEGKSTKGEKEKMIKRRSKKQRQSDNSGALEDDEQDQ